MVTEGISQGIVQIKEDIDDITKGDTEAEAEVDNIEKEGIIDMIAVVVEAEIEVIEAEAEMIGIKEDQEAEKEVMKVIIEIEAGIEDLEVKVVEVEIVDIVDIVQKKGILRNPKIRENLEGKNVMIKIMIIVMILI